VLKTTTGDRYHLVSEVVDRLLATRRPGRCNVEAALLDDGGNRTASIDNVAPTEHSRQPRR